MKVSYSRLFLVGLLLAAAGGCSESIPASRPATVTSPTPAPPPAAPPQAIPQKFAAIAGVYNLMMTVGSFDPVWGDLTGHRYAGVLTLVDGAGSFSEMRLFNAAGENVVAPFGGSVTRGVDPNRTVLHVGTNIVLVVGSLGEPDQGQTASPRFAGNFGVAGHIGGPFVATRITP